MVATDIGNICSVSNSYLRFRNPRSFFAAMTFGNCGYAFPAAMGEAWGGESIRELAPRNALDHPCTLFTER